MSKKKTLRSFFLKKKNKKKKLPNRWGLTESFYLILSTKRHYNWPYIQCADILNTESDHRKYADDVHKNLIFIHLSEEVLEFGGLRKVFACHGAVYSSICQRLFLFRPLLSTCRV